MTEKKDPVILITDDPTDAMPHIKSSEGGLIIVPHEMPPPPDIRQLNNILTPPAPAGYRGVVYAKTKKQRKARKRNKMARQSRKRNR